MTDLHALATTIRNDANAVSNNSPAIKKTLLAQADFNDAVGVTGPMAGIDARREPAQDLVELLVCRVRRLG